MIVGRGTSYNAIVNAIEAKTLSSGASLQDATPSKEFIQRSRHTWMLRLSSLAPHERAERKRTMRIIYEMKDGSEVCQKCDTEQEWRDERAAAELEVASKGTLVAGFRMEYGSCLSREQRRRRYYDAKMNDLAARNRAY